MGFDRIRGQERPKSILENTLKNGRLAQSYLFAGPAGVGKELAAFEMARAVNCLSAGRGTVQGCGECPSCRKIAMFRHPDVMYTFPVPSGLKPEEIGDIIKERAENPGRTVMFEKRASISIEMIRALKQESSYHVYEGRYKVAVIRDADLMNAAAANALLKLLEEPPAQMLLFLTTSRMQSLLPTILSRCQQIRFGFLGEEDIAAILRDVHGVEPDRARLAAGLAGGTVAGALEMLDDDLDTVRDAAAAMFAAVASPDVLDAFAAVESVARGRNSGVIERLLRMLSGYYRDMLLIKTGAPGSSIGRERAAELERAAATLPVEGIAAAGEAIERFRGMLASNVNAMLVLFNLVQELKACTVQERTGD